MNLRFGICNFPPNILVTGPKSIGGDYASVYQPVLDILSSAFNINYTLQGYDNCTIETCFDNQNCFGTLYLLQTGEVDYISSTPYHVIKDIGPNMTIFGMSEENVCYLANKRKLKANLDYLSFFDFIYAFNSNFWLLFFFLFGGLSIILTITFVKQNKLSLTVAFWVQFEYILGQNYNLLSIMITKFTLVFYILSIFLIGKLFTGSVRTGLVSHFEYLKIQTAEEIIKHKYTPLAQAYEFCFDSLQDEFNSIKNVSHQEIIVQSFRGETLEDTYLYITQDKHISALNLPWYQIFKCVGCNYFSEQEKNEPFEISPNPICESFTARFFNKLIEPKVYRNLRNYDYWKFEASINSAFHKLVQKVLKIPAAPISCLDHKDDESISSAPISINYLTVPLLILIVGHLIAFLIFSFNKILK